VVPLIWGAQDIIGPRAPGLEGSVSIFGRQIPQYDVFLIAVGPVVMLGLWGLLNKTRAGRIIRAATEDREMASALGIRQDLLFTGVFMLGSALAGLGGALQLPRETLHHSLDKQVIVSAFVVVVIGGMGSIGGAFVASAIVSLVSAFGIVIWPQGTLVMLFLIMVVVLVLRPQGLFGRPAKEDPHHPVMLPSLPRTGFPKTFLYLSAAGVVMLFGMGMSGSSFVLDISTQVFIAILFAASLHILMGWSGIISFGHAGLFGLGAYGAALSYQQGFPLFASLASGVLVAGLVSALFGFVVRRMRGVYLAMLTLAFSQLLYATAFQWISFTGGDNGILGLWPDAPFDTVKGWYWLCLSVTVMVICFLAYLYKTPFAYVLRAAQDAEHRARADALPVDGCRVLAFGLSGAIAGLAGGLLVFLKGSAFPSLFDIPQSVDGLVMVLLGGIAHPLGPILGATVYTMGVNVLASWTTHWHMIIGAVILFLTQAAPGGILVYKPDAKGRSL